MLRESMRMSARLPVTRPFLIVMSGSTAETIAITSRSVGHCDNWGADKFSLDHLLTRFGGRLAAMATVLVTGWTSTVLSFWTGLVMVLLPQ